MHYWFNLVFYSGFASRELSVHLFLWSDGLFPISICCFLLLFQELRWITYHRETLRFHQIRKIAREAHTRLSFLFTVLALSWSVAFFLCSNTLFDQDSGPIKFTITIVVILYASGDLNQQSIPNPNTHLWLNLGDWYYYSVSFGSPHTRGFLFFTTFLWLVLADQTISCCLLILFF